MSDVQRKFRNRRLTAEEAAQRATVRAAAERDARTGNLTPAAATLGELLAQHAASSAALREVVTLLNRERVAQGLTLVDVEQRAGIPRESLSRLEHAAAPNPTLETVERYARALGKTMLVALADAS